MLGTSVGAGGGRRPWPPGGRRPGSEMLWEWAEGWGGGGGPAVLSGEAAAIKEEEPWAGRARV